MAGAALLGRLNWRVAQVVDVVTETPWVKTITFDVPGWPGHRAGQHVDVRLTAEYGYQAQRSYSVASAPGAARVELTVERFDDGEVSPYLTDELRPGDQIELRGPVGGYFVWEPSQNGPLLLVAGGSGVVPLMAMVRLRAAAGSDADTRLLFSSRGWDDIIYRDELQRLTGNGLTVRAYVDTVAAARLDGPCRPRRRRDACPGRPEPAGAAARLCLWPDAVRRGGGRGAGAPRAQPASNQNRAFRTHGRLRRTSWCWTATRSRVCSRRCLPSR
jgi:ferredoxin-NADP reductase